jgi:SAM-dependent methyltransferase
MMWQKYIDAQYRQPSGLVGRWIGSKMAQQHRPENRWTVNLLDVQPGDHILEVGFGPGIAVEEVASRVAQVTGIDFSKAMVAAARKRNAAAIRSGRVDLRFGDATSLPFSNGAFDKAYSIHSIYFWPDPMTALGEIYRVLKTGGLLVLTVLPKEKWNPANPELAGTPECKPYSGEELKTMLGKIGFINLRIETDSRSDVPSNYSVIGYK